MVAAVVLVMGHALPAPAAEAGTPKPAEAKKAKPTEKLRSGAVIGVVLELPEVKKWQQWVESGNNGHTLSAWGQDIMHVGDNACSDIAVAETDADGNSHVWIHFCVTPGGAVMVETTPRSPEDEVTFMTYDEWKKKCFPTGRSPGIC